MEGVSKIYQTKESKLKGVSQHEQDRQKRLIYVNLLFCIKAFHDRTESLNTLK